VKQTEVHAQRLSHSFASLIARFETSYTQNFVVKTPGETGVKGRTGRKKLGGEFLTFFVKIGFHSFKPMDNIENRAKKKSKGKVNLNIRNLIPFFETPTRHRAKAIFEHTAQFSFMF